MNTPITICLDLPPKELSPNARCHWAAKARAVRAYRGTARWIARLTLGRLVSPRWLEAKAETTFFFPDRRRRDRDNLLASLKAAFDGIADAGIIENDARLIPHPPDIAHDPKNPRVEIIITPTH